MIFAPIVFGDPMYAGITANASLVSGINTTVRSGRIVSPRASAESVDTMRSMHSRIGSRSVTACWSRISIGQNSTASSAARGSWLALDVVEAAGKRPRHRGGTYGRETRRSEERRLQGFTRRQRRPAEGQDQGRRRRRDGRQGSAAPGQD